MFDIAWSELLLIAVIALIFIGPKELPQVLHTFGRMVAKLRRSACSGSISEMRSMTNSFERST